MNALSRCPGLHRRALEFRNLRGVTALTVAMVAMMAMAPVLAAEGGGGSTAGVQITQAWIRWLPANLPAGGYLTVTNSGDQPLELTSVSSPEYGSVALHRSLNQNGTSTMVPVDRIIIPAHSTLSFAAEGYHLMLMQPTRLIAPGDHVPGTLHFANGGSLTTSFEVRQPDAAPPGAAGDMHSMPGMPGMPH